jgi:23S rRNA (adenine2503-C2)-methyltransferase
MKFGRNLTRSEILDQVLHFRRIEPVDHLVYMGMGEPTMNMDNVLGAARRLPDVGITHRRTGISTVGWVPGIHRLTESDMPIRLALSLHAPEDTLRSRIMPVNDRYPLAEVLAACEAYYARRRRQVFIEYLMLDGVNDTHGQAIELAGLLDPRIYKVNLIPYNPTGSVYEGSSRGAIDAFRAVLEAHGLRATVRLTRGRDIDAACGQLAARAAAARRASRPRPLGLADALVRGVGAARRGARAPRGLHLLLALHGAERLPLLARASEVRRDGDHQEHDDREPPEPE